MKKKFDNKYSSNKNLDLQSTYFSDQIRTTNINILLNRVKVEKKNNFKRKLHLFSMMSLIIIFFSVIVISI
tara:strand:+ start:283 stop:495 length:213 start_codon:yes stop_codon:yes gene_type:complete